MLAVKYREEILVTDAGLLFPEAEMLGTAPVSPEISYLVENKEKIKGLILTHGHEDHIGALPYVLRQLNMDIYGTRLTLGLAGIKLKEHGLEGQARLIPVQPGETRKIGVFRVDFMHVNHSIAGVVALAIHTPVGTVVHTSDFKVDHTPVEGAPLDFGKFADLGDEGVLVLLSD